MHRFALCVVALLVCAGLASPAVRSSVPAAIVAGKVLGARSAKPVQNASRLERSHCWRAADASSAVDLLAIEPDVDEDSLRESLEQAHVGADGMSAPRLCNERRRSALSTDPSREARGACLPRGPPVFVRQRFG